MAEFDRLKITCEEKNTRIFCNKGQKFPVVTFTFVDNLGNSKKIEIEEKFYTENFVLEDGEGTK